VQNFSQKFHWDAIVRTRIKMLAADFISTDEKTVENCWATSAASQM